MIVRERSAAELVHLASRDALTGLLNRRAFAGRLAEEGERRRRMDGRSG